ncbi:lymphocyte antigen 6A-2/6E-1-like isoform X2 [Apodemus sylvaticus]|uniref:lymphocyte antigen 6A-2/6E-1-like isoform X2 n=1 Tax=Apodemus sylvaticus TaxID=10129 RepID=UPI0022440843|nr:lymphocyte antigen 6A-2/6E-1-like isoform X2 [Apodemus sylvaticus]
MGGAEGKESTYCSPHLTELASVPATCSEKKMNTSRAAKSCVLILLVALLCAERAQGLECYQCMDVPVGVPCPIVYCPDTDRFCVTQVAEDLFGSQKLKIKRSSCVPSCPSQSENMPFPGPSYFIVKTYCCIEDLCNAAVPTGGNTWTMAGVLLFSLGSVLLQTLL